jgi:hypothetical protein
LKNRIFHIVVFYCLLANVLFSQVISGFFHEHHDQDHAAAIIKKSGLHETVLKELSPKCKVCSSDIFHELFYNENTSPGFSHKIVGDHQTIHIHLNSLFPSFHQGRAPPASSSYLI